MNSYYNTMEELYKDNGVSNEIAEQAERIIKLCQVSNLGTPWVVPTAEKGGVQLEWHIQGNDIELELSNKDTQFFISMNDCQSKQFMDLCYLLMGNISS